MSGGRSASTAGDEVRRGIARPAGARDVSLTNDEGVSPAEKRASALKRRLARLALDVHDGPMQNLTVIGLDLNALRGRIRPLVSAEQYPKVDAGVEQIMDELAQVERDLRALLGALENGGSDSTSLLEGIEVEIVEFKRHSPVDVDLVVDGHACPETDSQRIALQAITHAALTNVAKHADADTVTIRLTGTDDAITLEIEDDGRGFEVDKAARPGHFGLAGMRERAELLGGHTQIRSRPGGPTVITATLESWRPPARTPRARGLFPAWRSRGGRTEIVQ